MWSNLRSFALGKEKKHTNLDATEASSFNKFFAGVGQRIATQLAAQGTGNLSPRPPAVVSAGFRIQVATLPELGVALKKMSNSAAVGCDGVSLQILRRCFVVVGPHVLRVINRSIITGEVPRLWKQAIVVPIHKSGDKGEPGNYRPISILSVIGKLAEKVVCTHLTEFLESNDLLFRGQYAYRPGRSTEDAVVDIMSTIAKNRELGHVTCLTSCDLSKAFDCVDRGALLGKMGWYGVSTHWFENYFVDRTQSVRGSDTIESVNYGVVQGSTLGPALFSLYTNDLNCYLSDMCKFESYADDSVLAHGAPPTEEGVRDLRRGVERDLAVMAQWFIANGLKANPDKTEMTIVGTPAAVKSADNFRVSFDGVQLVPAESVKYLGVIIDQCLSMDKQVSKVVQRCYGCLITLKKLNSCLPKATMQRLVEALVMPHVTYCLTAWAPPTQLSRGRIDKMLNFGVRVITGLRKRDRVTGARQQLGWLDFDNIIDKCDCALVHKMLYNGNMSSDLKQLAVPRAEVHDRTTRATVNGVLDVQRCRLDVSKQTVPVRSFNAWNALPRELRLVAERRLFLKNLRGTYADVEE